MIEPDLSQLIKVLQLRQSNAKNLNKTWFFPFLEKNTSFPLPISSPNYDNDGWESIEYNNNLAFTQLSRAALWGWAGNEVFLPPPSPKRSRDPMTIKAWNKGLRAESSQPAGRQGCSWGEHRAPAAEPGPTMQASISSSTWLWNSWSVFVRISLRSPVHLQHWNHSKIPINWDAGYSSKLQKTKTKKQKGTSSKTHWQSKTTDNKKRELKKKEKKRH